MRLRLDPYRWAGLDLGLPRSDMRLDPTVQDSVVFIGYQATYQDGGIRPIGTAFLFTHERYGYLVTAQHIAMEIGDNPFAIRFNRKAGGSHAFNVDPLEHDIKWVIHPDPNVDLAILPFHKDLDEHALRCKFIPSTMGAHLVGVHSLDGLSGSPVFVRPPVVLANVRAPVTNSPVIVSQDEVKLLGIWHGSWRGSELFVVKDVTGERARPSFGMGVVIPAGYLMEILDGEELTEQRRRHFAGDAVTPVSVSVDKEEAMVASKPDNPSHKEDLSLPGVASKANKPGS
jgi:hypothetical protein